MDADKRLTRDEIKKILKDMTRKLRHSPTYWSVVEWIEQTDYYNEFDKIIEEIGKELEQENEIVIWNFCKNNDANCIRFFLER